MAIVSFIASSSISAGDAVYLTASGFVQKAIATNQQQASVAGVAVDTVSSGSLVRVNPDSVYTAFTSLTPGELRYLSIATSGALVDYATWQTQLNALSASGAFLTTVGRSLTSTNMDVEISKPLYIPK